MNQGKNVILLTIDCLRADHLGCLGYSTKISPYIDSLARKGVLFSQAMSNGGNTVSSFPSLLTSSYPRVHYSDTNEKTLPYRWLFLSETRKSIAEALKSNGYKTAAFHSNPWISSFFNYDKGFDTFYDKTDSSITKGEVFSSSNILYRALDAFRLGYALYNVIRGSKGNADRANVINDRAISWLREHSDSFFVWLHYMDVHEPYVPLDSTILERADAIRLFMKGKNPRHFSEHDLKTLIDFYDREIRYVDREIGSFLGEMSKMGLLDNTYVVLTADHGEQFMEHGLIGHGYLYDEVIHVPLIIAGPGLPPGVVVQELVCLLDLSPTILDLLNAPRMESFQGTSLLPKIRGEKGREGIIIEGVPFLYSGKIAHRFCFRTEKWKYILLLDENYKQIDAELYNLLSDPKEKNDIIDKEIEIANEMNAKLLDHIATENQERKDRANVKGLPKIEYNEKEKKEIMKRLKSLGYM